MGSLLIKAGRVFDGRAERALEHAYVIIDGDAIKAVGPQTELEGSSGRFAREIDLGPEATVLPGLINMHTHMSFSGGHTIFSDHQEESYETKLIRATENLKIALSTGVTTMRDCGTLNGIAFPLRDAVERGIFQGPRIIASGQGITTTGGHLWFCGVEADSETEVRRAVRSQVKAGADFIKVFATGGNSTPGTNPLAAQYSAAEMCALTEEAQRLGKRVAAHAHGTPGVHHAIAAKVTTIEHCSFMQADGLRYEPEQARRIADAGLYVCPTVFRGQSKFYTLEEAQTLPEIAGLLAYQQARFDLVRQFVEDGVRIVSGSDAGVTLNTFADYPGDLVYTAEGTDLSPVYVLKSATSVAAEALGRDDLGLLMPGKASDLLAVRGNPLQDIRALLSPQLVVARGRVVYE
jgi:imidazolonepropionase-like amidohydrolase